MCRKIDVKRPEPDVPHAVIYTAPDCFGCANIKQFFTDRGIPYTERDITNDGRAFDEFEWLGYRATPVSVINGIAIWGYDKRALEAALSGNKGYVREEEDPPTRAAGGRIVTMVSQLARGVISSNGSGLSGKAIAGGAGGATIASLCCLPGAVAIALGASAGTAVTLFRLQELQVLFQVGGVGFALGTGWWIIRRSRQACTIGANDQVQKRSFIYVIGGFAISFAVLNLIVIPLLEG